MTAMKELMQDQELKSGVTDMMASAQGTADAVAELTGTMNQLLVQNQDEFNNLLVTTGRTMANMEEMSLEIKNIVAQGVLEDKAIALMDSLTEAVNQGKLLVSDLRELTGDPELHASLKSSLKSFEEITANGTTISSDLTEMTASGKKVAKDFESLSENGILISEETLILMKKANTLVDDVTELVNSFKSTVDGFRGMGGGLFPEVDADFSVGYQSHGQHIRTDANITIPGAQDDIVIGLYDALETNRINAQIRKRMDKGLGLRYGVYAGKPGVGVDYRLASSLNLRSDIYGFNDPRFDLRLTQEFGGGIRGWAGLEGIFRESSPAIGFSFGR
jgi:phospholipid/cholesterol/gamma-HCH transport system substrate-binding protein